MTDLGPVADRQLLSNACTNAASPGRGRWSLVGKREIPLPTVAEAWGLYDALTVGLDRVVWLDFDPRSGLESVQIRGFIPDIDVLPRIYACVALGLDRKRPQST